MTDLPRVPRDDVDLLTLLEESVKRIQLRKQTRPTREPEPPDTRTPSGKQLPY